MIRSNSSFLSKSRHGIYYFRVKVHGKDIKRSLETRCTVTAKLRLHKFSKILELIHEGSSLSKIEQYLTSISSDRDKTVRVRNNIHQRLMQALEFSHTDASFSPYIAAYEEITKEPCSVLRKAELFRNWLFEMVQLDKVSNQELTAYRDDISIALTEIAHVLASSQYRAASTLLQRLDTHIEVDWIREQYSDLFLEYGTSLHEKLQSEQQLAAQYLKSKYATEHKKVQVEPQSTLRFADAAHMFYSENDYDDEYVASKSNIYKEGIQAFDELFPNIVLSDISPANVKEFAMVVSGLPARRNTDSKYRSLAIREQVKLASSNPDDIISPKTVQTYIRLKTVFSYFKDSGWIDNDFDSLFKNHRSKKLKGKAGKKNVRAFDQHELNLLFNGYAFVPNTRPSKQHLQRENPEAYAAIYEGTKTCTNIPTLTGKDYLFWATLLSLYSGCRANEVCQLRTDMVYLHDAGFYYFEIKSEDALDPKTGAQLSAKNDSSERFVPIHPDLISMGFADFWNLQKKRQVRAGGRPVQLFKNIKWSKHHKNFSTDLTKNFACYRRVVGVGLKNGLGNRLGSVDFHSFRRTFARYFINNVSESDLSLKRLKDIVGHKDEDITTGVYAGLTDLPVLYSDILKFDVSKLGIDLSHISWGKMKKEYS